MLSSFPIAILVGTLLGFLSGLGTGGGSLLILWLTFILGTDYPQARGINLMFFIPAAAVALYFRGKQGMVPWKTVLPGMLSGCVCAAACSFLSTWLDLALLRKLFGGLLIFTAIRELCWRPQK